MSSPRTPRDDLTEIASIGERIEAKLKHAGIHTFAQLGKTSVERLAAYSGYSVEQIAQKDWIGQANVLAGLSTEVPVDADVRPPSRHNFTVALQLDPTSGAILSCDVHHVQSGEQQTWQGWYSDRVVAFMVHQANIDPQAASERAADHQASGPPTEPEVDRPEASLVVAFTQVRAERLLAPGSGPMIATLTLDVSELASHDISATMLEVEIYGQRPPFGASRLIGHARSTLRKDSAMNVELDLPDEARESPLELFAILTFLGTPKANKRPTRIALAQTRLGLRSRD